MTSIQVFPRRSAETYYKAVRPDGTDFYSGLVAWGHVGEIVRHPNPGSPSGDGAEGYLSVSVSLTDCTGMKWPCRLLVVEPVEGVPVWAPTPSLPSKRASHAWRVVRELPAYEALGPHGVEVVAFLELLPTLTDPQWDAAMYAAWDNSRDNSWYAARYAAWDNSRDNARDAAEDAAMYAARDAAEDAAMYAAMYAARALVLRDLITTEQFDTLTAPMRSAGVNFDTLTAPDKLLEGEKK